MSKKIESHKSLLKNTSVLSDNNKKLEKTTGYNFNIFSITNIERLEVNTHSAMLAELLSPSGSHGQGSIFLEKFTEILEVKELCTFDEVKVLKEKSFNGGSERIDILIKFSDFTIFIENKIDAPDQPNQLVRYNKIAEDGPDYRLVYLTKHGNEATEGSCGIGKEKVEYEQISYYEDVVRWLELCIKEVALVPIVREAILQYYNLVKKITGTGMSELYQKEIVKLLSEGGNIFLAEELVEAIPKAKGKKLYDFFSTLKTELEKEKSIKVLKDRGNTYDNDKCIEWFSMRKSKKPQGFGLFFDIGIKNILFHVQVATTAFHYGVVSATFDEKVKKPFYLVKTEKYERRDWAELEWYSYNFLGSVTNKMKKLIDEESSFIDEIKESIVMLQNNPPAWESEKQEGINK